VSKAAKTLNIILLPALVLVWVIPVGVVQDTGLIALTSKSLVSTPTQQETRTLPPTNNAGDDKDPLLSSWLNGVPEAEKEVWRQFISQGRYRAAQADDFFLSLEARKILGLAPDTPNDTSEFSRISAIAQSEKTGNRGETKSNQETLVRSVNHEMIEEIHLPYIDWRKPGYASLPACRHALQACWKPKRAWNWMRVIAGDDRST
jgi:hypothetical protein